MLYRVHVEHPPARETTVEVEAPSPMLAAEAAERMVWAHRGGGLPAFFAYKVEPVAPPCEVCRGLRYIEAERDDGRMAIEACDACTAGTGFRDAEAAKAATAAGYVCDPTYPFIIH